MSTASLPLSHLDHLAQSLAPAQRQPSLFIGHGSPMNALQDNSFTQRLKAIGQKLPVPTAILVVSAHWETDGSWVCVAPQPKTIHDFGGFPPALFQEQYPAPGAPQAARWTIDAAHSFTPIQATEEWGLDHGAWTVLKFLYPHANVPVFQLSINARKPEAWHAELAGHLRSLRDRGVMILGSGNIVHNLGKIDWNPDAATFDWALEFDQQVASTLDKGQYQALYSPNKNDSLFRLAVPTNDHYLPLLYTLGASYPSETVSTLYQGFQHGSISMRCIGFGLG